MAQPRSPKGFAPQRYGCRQASSPTKRQWAQSWRRRCAREIANDLGVILKGMAEHHPHEPHWYLPVVAADPNWIGQGLGALLMKHALRRCDEEGIAAYLESSNPRNISLYERHGFRIVGRIQSGSSPVMTPMLRPAS
jgi:ribosomal protein S18 acetylase RimI-like enzyme